MTLNGGVERFVGDPVERRSLLMRFTDFADVAIELIKAQLAFGLPQSVRLEPISTAAGRLLFEAGVVATLDEGVVVFHERISRDKPALRRELRASDRRAGRLKKVRTTRAQRAARQALKAGLVTRQKNGRIKAFTPQARALIKKAKRKEQAARDKKKRALQATALAKLKGIGA